MLTSLVLLKNVFARLLPMERSEVALKCKGSQKLRTTCPYSGLPAFLPHGLPSVPIFVCLSISSSLLSATSQSHPVTVLLSLELLFWAFPLLPLMLTEAEHDLLNFNNVDQWSSAGSISGCLSAHAESEDEAKRPATINDRPMTATTDHFGKRGNYRGEWLTKSSELRATEGQFTTTI